MEFISMRTDKDLKRIKKVAQINFQKRDYHKPVSVCAKLCYEHFLLQAFRSMKKPNHYEATENESS